MKVKNYKHIVFVGLGVVITTILYLFFIKSAFFQDVIIWSQENLLLYFSILTLFKVIGIVWPPIPGGLLTLGSIPVIGWQYAYASDLLGSVIGSSIAFYLGKKYGYRLLKMIFDAKTIGKIRKTNIKKKKEFEAIFVMRILGGTVIEVVCYGAGLLKVNYMNFIFASFVSHTIIGIPTYYLADNLFDLNNVLINVTIIIVAILVIRKVKGRYFE